MKGIQQNIEGYWTWVVSQIGLSEEKAVQEIAQLRRWARMDGSHVRYRIKEVIIVPR